MPLHLVGETIDKFTSHRLAEEGRLLKLMRGVYVNADDDADALVLRHAVRIAGYLYPKAYLSAASAVLLGPTRDGRLFLSARRRQRTRIRGLEIIQNESPRHPSTAEAFVDDGMGEFRVHVSGLRQRLLESFRARSEHAASITATMREQIADRLVAEYGSVPRTVEAVWAFARDNAWYREAELAERFLTRGPAALEGSNRAALDLVVAWHGEPVGHLLHDGFEWRWVPSASEGPPLVRQSIPGKLPPFLSSLLPEGWLQQVLRNQDERALLRTGRRYLSNITIAEKQDDLRGIPQDVLGARLAGFSSEGVFVGAYRGPARTTIESSFEANLAEMFRSADMPRLSGIQIKAPMHLDRKGVLWPGTAKPFTHILKPAGTSGYEQLPIAEWIALHLAQAVGFAVPDHALVAMPDDMPPALLVERFDIRTSTRDRRRIALEDMCSVLDLPPDAKYSGSMERVARSVRSLSTDPEADLRTVLLRALFAWLIADGDLHLKNMALLKVAKAESLRFDSVRIAPVYDAVTTRVFPHLQQDPQAMTVNGKKERLTPKDFQAFAATAGIKAGVARKAIEETCSRLREALDHVVLPATLKPSAAALRTTETILQLGRDRIANFA